MATDRSTQLRSLVNELKTRSPQEVMGEAATRSLMGSVVTAAVAMIGLMLLSTLAIFFVVGPPEIREKAKPKPVAAATDNGTLIQDSQTSSETSSEIPGTTTAAPNTNGGTGTNTDPDTASDPVEAMGIGETKDPDSETDTLDNRLDNRLDDLLQGLE